jgi:hypothetical protein
MRMAEERSLRIGSVSFSLSFLSTVTNENMKPSDLRIGNLIYMPNGNVGKVGYEVIRAFVVLEPKPDYKPIELTEEYILRFGFEKFSGVGLFRIVNKDLTMSLMIAFTGIHYTLSITAPSSPIKYVHQLQNIYFALVGEELVLED